MLQDLVNAYEANRMKADPLPKGSAPFTAAHLFKLRRSGELAKDWSHKFSLEGRSRVRSTMKVASRIKKASEVISLGTARPASQYYPWNNVKINAADPRYREGKDLATADMLCCQGETPYDLGLALNYGYAAGSPQVVRFIAEQVEMVHRPLYDDWECSLTCGTTSALDIIFRMLCDHGDSILAETFSYPGTIEATKALGLKMVGVRMDEMGMLPEDLEARLSHWDTGSGPKPSLLYVIPTGQNPTGATQSLERRQAIYEIAERHDLIILEDDPYYFIQLQEPQSNGRDDETANGMFHASAVISSHGDITTAPQERLRNQYLQRLPASYISLDRSGRVLRLDATSKILAPGLRCGWLTGCKQFVNKFIDHTEMSTVAPSGLSQAFLYKLLDETWGHAGFFDWVGHLSSQFRQRLATLVRACEQNLPRGLCAWNTPTSGMFLWLQVDWRQHPDTHSALEGESNKLILHIEDKVYLTALEHGVLVSKGSWFAVDPSLVQEISFRMTFAAEGDDALIKAVERFGRALRDEFRLP